MRTSAPNTTTNMPAPNNAVIHGWFQIESTNRVTRENRSVRRSTLTAREGSLVLRDSRLRWPCSSIRRPTNRRQKMPAAVTPNITIPKPTTTIAELPRLNRHVDAGMSSHSTTPAMSSTTITVTNPNTIL